MKLTVLGAWGAYPKAGEATSGYLLEVEDHKILIDCGSGVLSTLQKIIPLHELTAVFISHHHHDHIADLGCLEYACLIDTDLNRRNEELPLYIANEEAYTSAKSMKGTSRRYIVEKSKVTFEGNLNFSFFKTFHDGNCLGMRISYKGKVLVYTADTYFDESLIAFCKDADMLIAETSFYAEFDAKPYGHMNSYDVGKLAREANVKRLVLTHLPHFGNLNELTYEVRKYFNEEVNLAFTGMEIYL